MKEMPVLVPSLCLLIVELSSQLHISGLQWWPASAMCWCDSDTDDVGRTNTAFISPLEDETQDGQRWDGQEPVLDRPGGLRSNQTPLLC